jgi:all-trans-retinol 13,14-reductase
MPKTQLTLLNKTELSPKVYLLTFKTEDDLTYAPGQFLSLEVEPKVNRPYSISYMGKKVPYFETSLQSLPTLTTGDYITLMISTKPGGTASTFFDNITVGTSLNAIGPAGRFKLIPNSKPKVFVATGTGLAPFVSMIHELVHQDPNTRLDVFFGCWDLSGNFVNRFFDDLKTISKNLNIYTVAEDLKGESETDYLKGGRVTTVIPQTLNDFVDTDFYLCGHPAMVAAMEEVLKQNSATDTNIVMEKFGN